MAGRAARVVVFRPDVDRPWRVQREGKRPADGKARPIVGEYDEHPRFVDAHAAALELELPVYVPAFAYDPLEDEPGWDEADGAAPADVTEHLHRKLGVGS